MPLHSQEDITPAQCRTPRSLILNAHAVGAGGRASPADRRLEVSQGASGRVVFTRVTILGSVDSARRKEGTKYRVTDMAETETDTAKLAPDALLTEIERTRAELARTIDEIADRVSPSKVAQRTSDRVRERIGQIDPLIGGAVALAAVSVTCYVIWRRLRK